MTWVHIVWFLLAASCPIIYHTGANQQSILIFGNLAKIFSLLVAGLSLTFTTNAYTPGEPAKRAWTLLSAGMWIWFFAQTIFAQYKIVLGLSPYPSTADVFFVAAYLPLFAGVLVLISDFRNTGLPMGSRNSYIVQSIILLILYAALFFKWLLPLATNDDPLATRLLNVGYPTCDFVLFALTSVLIRISWALRGGSLAKTYIALALSFILIAIADIIFAYKPFPTLDILFFSAYFLNALAGVYQFRAMRQ
ncbi:MAG TPA: hypothetical protein VLH08_21155 [Acidobacteriota bacterium]|jgi:hypothetical protein|nr:hypothetical protein [Acidobacteriota bacterium]